MDGYLLSGDDGSIGDQGEVDPGVGDQVGLELVEVHVQGAVEPQGSRDRGDDLADQPEHKRHYNGRVEGLNKLDPTQNITCSG